MRMKFQFNVLTIYLSFVFQEKPQVQEPESYATLRKLQNLEKKQKEEIDRWFIDSCIGSIRER